MSILLNLPDELVQDILQNWCSMKDTIKIDLLTNGKLHKYLGSCFERNRFDEKYLCKLIPRIFLYKWLFNRKIRGTTLTLDSVTLDFIEKEVKFHTDFCFVFGLIIHENCDVDDIADIVDACHSLTSLSLPDHLFLELTKFPVEQLQHLSISSRNSWDNNALFSKVSLCRNITDLSISIPYFTWSKSLMENIFFSVPNLRSIHFAGDLEEAQIVILNNCANIENISLNFTSCVHDTYDGILFNPNVKPFQFASDLLATAFQLRSLRVCSDGTIEYSVPNKDLRLDFNNRSPEINEFVSRFNNLIKFTLVRPLCPNSDRVLRALHASASTLRQVIFYSGNPRLPWGGPLSYMSLSQFFAVAINLEFLQTSAFLHEGSNVLSNPEIIDLFRHSNQLKNLQLRLACPSLVTVGEIIKLCPHLTEFSFARVRYKLSDVQEFHSIMCEVCSNRPGLSGIISFQGECREEDIYLEDGEWSWDYFKPTLPVVLSGSRTELLKHKSNMSSMRRYKAPFLKLQLNFDLFFAKMKISK